MKTVLQLIALFFAIGALAGCATNAVLPAHTQFQPVVYRVAQEGYDNHEPYVYCRLNQCPRRTPKLLAVALPTPVAPVTLAPAPSLPPSTPTPAPRKAVTTITRRIYFLLGSTSLTTAAHDALAKLAPEARAAQNITLVGHTDKLGSRALNERLAQRRAWAVRRALIRLRVLPQRIAIETDCCIGSKPIDPSARRTDVTVRLSTTTRSLPHEH